MLAMKETMILHKSAQNRHKRVICLPKLAKLKLIKIRLSQLIVHFTFHKSLKISNFAIYKKAMHTKVSVHRVLTMLIWIPIL